MMRMNRMIWIIFFIIVFLITIPIIAQADLKDILTTLHPSISIQEEYNNNINLTPRNKIDDFITTAFLGLRIPPLDIAELKDKKYGIDLFYNAGFVFYAKETANNYVSHNGTLNAWYRPSPRWRLGLREYLIRSEEPREREFTQGALPEQFLLGTQRQRAVYFRNVIEPVVEYQFGREDRISVNYRNNLYNTQNPLSEDSREDFIGSTLTYWLNVKNGISLNYGFTRGDFERSPGFTAHSTTGRYTYRFSPRTSVFGDYSFEKRDFESSSFGSPSPSSNDYVVHRPSAGIDHAFTPTLSGGAQFGYFWQKPDQGSTTDGLYYNLNLTQRSQKTTYTLAFQGGYTEDFFTAENLGFTKYQRLVGTVTHRLKERMTVGAYSSFEEAKSVGGATDQTNRIWGIGVNSTYQLLRWMSLALDVSHRENHSNIADGGYSEYRASIGVTATY